MTDSESKPTDVSVLAANAAAQPWGATQPPQAPSEDEKLWGMLANLLGLVFLIGPLVAFFLKGESKFVKFNALQTIFLQLACVVLSIVLGVVFTVLASIPIVGTLILSVIGPLLSLAMLVGLVLLALQAKAGVLYRLPLIGEIARTTVYK
jgi:uncharacterized membrane protein